MLECPVNSLRPSHCIWHYTGTWSIPVQVVACGLTAFSHYLNKCCLIKNEHLNILSCMMNLKITLNKNQCNISQGPMSWTTLTLIWRHLIGLVPECFTIISVPSMFICINLIFVYKLLFVDFVGSCKIIYLLYKCVVPIVMWINNGYSWMTA